MPILKLSLVHELSIEAQPGYFKGGGCTSKIHNYELNTADIISRNPPLK